jgi:hypothetical protein
VLFGGGGNWYAAHEHEIVCSARTLALLLLIVSLNQMWFDCVRPVGVVWWIFRWGAFLGVFREFVL